jgi:S-adenosylmethionine:tRNA ribosyltransferase-isomerase
MKRNATSSIEHLFPMSLLTRDYDYELPGELIASRPLARRDASRMMVLHRAERRIEHRVFADFSGYVRDGDLVVLNDTRVIPARAFSDDGKIELLFLEPVAAAGLGETGAGVGDPGCNSNARIWKCFVKPGRRMRLHNVITLGGIEGRVIDITATGERVIEFAAPVDLEKIGEMPIPPYFRREAEAADSERYQTVYARAAGAVAAPTAGLHFTREILKKIPHAFITLHVGAGTFKPVQTERITGHVMHSERFAISESAARAINAAAETGRIIAVGTTTTRVLESCARAEAGDGKIRAQEGATDIFIHPPFEFKIVDALLTNFHLPRSTLLMLVSAFAGREFVLRAYAEAIAERYRFYSYGDCMLIL